MERKIISEMAEVIRHNIEQRGLQAVNLKGELQRSAESLVSAETVMILTGFVIRQVMKGETDGPIGAVSLARVLEKLGKQVVMVTDAHSEQMVQACCKTAGVKAKQVTVHEDEIEIQCHQLIELYEPSHVVAIERPGRAHDGRCYSMRGEDLSDLVPNTDHLIEFARERGLVTIAVGDGGNEVGMGKIADIVKEHVPNGEKIGAIVATDYLIAAGVSNWGGHALGAAISVLTDKMLLHDELLEIAMLSSLVESGAVDGCSKKSETTVDGLSLEVNLEILNALCTLVYEGLTSDQNK